MTVVTLGLSGQVIRGLAISSHPIVTTRTTAQHLEVINCDRWFPHAGAVAVFTHFRCIDVFRALAGSRGAVMTTGAIGRNPFMVKRGREPGRGRVTIITLGLG